MSKAAKKAKKPTQAELDEQEIRELDGEIKEVLDLLEEGIDRDESTERVEKSRTAKDEHKGNSKEIFKKGSGGGGKPMRISMHNHSALEHADELKRRIKLGRHALDLQQSLANLLEKQIEVLERCAKRSRY